MTKNNLQKNIAMKDSGVDWIGKIPEEWEIINLKKLLNYVQPGKYITDVIQKTKFDDNAIPVLTANKGFVIGYTDKKDGIFDVDLPVIIFDDFTTNKKFVDFSFKVRSSALKILKSRSKNGADIRFIFKNMEVLGFHALEHNRHWISIYSKEYITFPNIDIQKCIADFLDEKTGKVDAVIKKKQKLIELLKEKRTSLITQAVTKGLNPNAKMKNSGVEWIGNIPKGWEVKKLKYIASLLTGNSIPDDEKGIYTENVNSYPYISSKDINLEFSNVHYKNGMYIPKINNKFKVAKKDSILLCIEGGSAGNKIAFISKDVCYVNKLCNINSNYYNNKYIYYFCKSRAFRDLFSLSLAGLIGGVSIQNLKRFLFVVPPTATQKRIADFLDEKTEKIDQVVQKIQEQIEKIKEYRASLIYHAVTGKIKI